MKQLQVLLSMAVAACLILSCVPQAQPNPIVTSVPPQTSTITFTTTAPTATANTTPTPRPTLTASPIPDWVTSFAEPILKAIENQQPRFQDDFSNPNSGWQIGEVNVVHSWSQATPPVPVDHSVGERGYIDGEYFIVAEKSCVGTEPNPHVGAYLDFVVEFDVRFFSGAFGNWGILFRKNDKGTYNFIGFPASHTVMFMKADQTNPGGTVLATYSGNQIKSGKEWNHMLLIVRGGKMAAYANGTPILYAEDKNITDDFKLGRLAVHSCTERTPPEVRWDNMKIWDIYGLP